jgi:predicted nucleic acid-binding protein
LENPSGSAAATLQRFQPVQLATCSSVRAELLHGAKKYGNAHRRSAMVKAALSAIASILFDDMAAD